MSCSPSQAITTSGGCDGCVYIKQTTIMTVMMVATDHGCIQLKVVLEEALQ